MTTRPSLAPYRRRLWAVRVLERATQTGGVASVAALGAVGLTGVTPTTATAAAVLASLTTLALVTWRERPSLLVTARHLDRAIGAQELITTAVSCDDTAPAAPLVQRAAHAHLQHVSASHLFPWRVSRLGLAVCAGALVVTVWPHPSVARVTKDRGTGTSASGSARPLTGAASAATGARTPDGGRGRVRVATSGSAFDDRIADPATATVPPMASGPSPISSDARQDAQGATPPAPDRPERPTGSATAVAALRSLDNRSLTAGRDADPGPHSGSRQAGRARETSASRGLPSTVAADVPDFDLVPAGARDYVRRYFASRDARR